jgi:hypothetical protein
MVPCSGTNISFGGDFDSFSRKTITIIVTKNKINAANTGNIAPQTVPPKIPAIIILAWTKNDITTQNFQFILNSPDYSNTL